ncbi:MAG: GntR family transcriptional regulator [Flammeovirgaceae bacterium]|nr:GntR family transcriptional regulator [Flammeovirgaceae bacterium]MBR10421.1 GntR family transcriptional regulator [Rickettsiales bacterium]HCX23803.1 GntR family transcriptional regulator [Cytophagales bacterium]|tara:strand:- start:2999 stop:3370 length:372 start_codon:yes stop_codon:yes gene_type:complete
MEFKDNQAIYLQIADLFFENILSEKWVPGDRIPSVREMAVTVEVNPNTVMRTFTYLQDKGIIYNKRGIGYFVSDDGFQLTKALKKDDFVSQELPELFKAMDLLNVSIDDLQSYYTKYRNGGLK